MTRTLVAFAALLGASMGLAGNARAADLGGHFGFGAALAAGTTHRQVSLNGQDYDEGGGGGGAGLDFAGRVWVGPLVVSGTALALPGLGVTELVATGGGGLKLQLGQRWRLMSLLEAGAHQLSGVGGDWVSGVVAGGKATLPCWAARLALVKRPFQTERITLGINLFLLVDGRTEEVNARVQGFLGSDNVERHRTGGKLGGVAFHATFGS